MDRGSASSKPIEALIDQLSKEKPVRFSHEDLVSFTSNFFTKIGFGSFGNVYKGRFPNGVEIAVKVLVETEVLEETFMAEVGTMGRTYHRNLVKLYGFCFDVHMKALVYEYMRNGSFDKFLYGSDSSLKWEKLYDIVVGIAKGLSYLHEGCCEQIIHHDIKAANVLLGPNLSPKIADFGLAKILNLDESHLTMTRIRGSPGYAAPETFMQSSRITFKCDVYSFGMMLFEVLGRRRNSSKDGWFPKQVWEKFEKGQLDEIIKDLGIGVKNRESATILCMVAFWCTQFTPEIRPSMSTVVKLLEKEMQVMIPPNPSMPNNSVLLVPSHSQKVISVGPNETYERSTAPFANENRSILGEEDSIHIDLRQNSRGTGRNTITTDFVQNNGGIAQSSNTTAVLACDNASEPDDCRIRKRDIAFAAFLYLADLVLDDSDD